MAHRLEVIGVEWCGGDSVVTDAAEGSMVTMPFYYYSGIEKRMQCLPAPRQRRFERMHAFCRKLSLVDMEGKGDRANCLSLPVALCGDL
mmetsp:Transcript_7474/g.18542  ORF Transcript_7474/g.18542 Transcript_7474/m.18542 type:complete len:89 (+) Transcript_7474:361-627(+)